MEVKDIRLMKKYKYRNYNGYVVPFDFFCEFIYIDFYNILGEFQVTNIELQSWFASNAEEFKNEKNISENSCPDCGGEVEWACMARKCKKCWKVM